MDPRLTRAEATYLPLPATPELERARALRLEAAEASQAALTQAASRVFARLGQALFGWVHRARIRAELGALSDRELADIGLTRGDIDYVTELAAATRPAEPRPAQRPAGIRVPRPA